MTNDVRLKVGREEWRKIESGETSFILRESPSPYETVAFVLTDAFTGTHLGNAIIETPFGDYEASPWTWSMFAKLTVQELKERFPAEASMENPCAMYEIKPISDKELLQRLCDE